MSISNVLVQIEVNNHDQESISISKTTDAEYLYPKDCGSFEGTFDFCILILIIE